MEVATRISGKIEHNACNGPSRAGPLMRALSDLTELIDSTIVLRLLYRCKYSHDGGNCIPKISNCNPQGRKRVDGNFSRSKNTSVSIPESDRAYSDKTYEEIERFSERH